MPDKLVKVNPAPYTLAPPLFITPFVVESCGRRRCARQSSGFIVPGRVSRRPASTPDARRGARARSSLLAAWARAPTLILKLNSEDPLKLFSFSFSQMNRVFEAFAMLEKLLNLAHLSDAVKNLIF